MYTKYIHAFPTMFEMLNKYMKYNIPKSLQYELNVTCCRSVTLEWFPCDCYE